MASVMMAKLELVTVSVKRTSLVHHVRSVFLENMAEIAQMVSLSLLVHDRYDFLTFD